MALHGLSGMVVFFEKLCIVLDQNIGIYEWKQQTACTELLRVYKIITRSYS